MLTKSMTMYVWAIGTLNQRSIGGYYSQIRFLKNEVVTGKNPAFDRATLHENITLSFVVL